MSHNCETCKFRQKYDNNPTSLLGRLWRWHINFCPGWKGYMKQADEGKRQELIINYKLNKR